MENQPPPSTPQHNNQNNHLTKIFVHKYQPIWMDDYMMNPKTRNVFKSLFKMDTINVLLIGSTSTGKTSMLNTIVREYYKDIPKSEYYDNVMYINNITDQGSQYLKSTIKTFCQTKTTVVGKKKVVVIDDLDMMNDQSQYIFCKYIDNYGGNVHFIVSCMNNQKITEGFQSRMFCIRLDRVNSVDLNTVVGRIMSAENIDIDQDAKEFIINISGGVVKIIINYLEKFKLLNERITVNIATEMCSVINHNIFKVYTTMILDNQVESAIQLIMSIYDNGYSVIDILDNYFSFLKITNVVTEHQKYSIIPIICKYIAIFHTYHENEIELALFTNNVSNAIRVDA